MRSISPPAPTSGNKDSCEGGGDVGGVETDAAPDRLMWSGEERGAVKGDDRKTSFTSVGLGSGEYDWGRDPIGDLVFALRSAMESFAMKGEENLEVRLRWSNDGEDMGERICGGGASIVTGPSILIL